MAWLKAQLVWSQHCGDGCFRALPGGSPVLRDRRRVTRTVAEMRREIVTTNVVRGCVGQAAGLGWMLLSVLGRGGLLELRDSGHRGNSVRICWPCRNRAQHFSFSRCFRFLQEQLSLSVFHPAPEAVTVQRAQDSPEKPQIPPGIEMPSGCGRVCCDPAEKQAKQRRFAACRGSEVWGLCSGGGVLACRYLGKKRICFSWDASTIHAGEIQRLEEQKDSG